MILSPSEARARLQEMVAAGESTLDLGLASLLIGAEDEGGVDVHASLEQLDRLAEPLEEPLQQGSLLQRVAALAEHLFVAEGFRGNSDAYEDPRNSYLHQVLERRLGIPITLSILLVEVGRRVGVQLHGVGFPTHFLVGIDEQPGLFVDPFNGGRILTVDECKALLHVRTGGSLAFHRRYLERTSTREVLARVLRNLKTNFARDDDLEGALRAVNRILILTPDNWVEWRDRGVLHLQLRAYDEAIRDLSRYLEEALEPTDREWVASLLEDARRGGS